jgi:hypothetical protein
MTRRRTGRAAALPADDGDVTGLNGEPAAAVVEPVAESQPAAESEPAVRTGLNGEPAAAVEPVAESQPAADEEPAADSELAADEEPPGRPAPDPAFDLAPADPAHGDRPLGLRLAGVHLHTGLHALARAELEAFAGRNRLDTPALLDLAEVRWRTGDLAGAGDAAKALLARGSEEPLALVIAAEAVAALGRPGEARRLAARVAALEFGPLPPLFAGMPMAVIWPDEPATVPGPEAPAAAADVRAAAPRRGRSRRGGAAQTADAPAAAAAPAAEAFAGGRGALAAGDHRRAALLLGVALRLDPGFAGEVLAVTAGRDEDPLLVLVEGDALRLLGRESEALAAFDRARGRHGEAAGPARGHDEPPSPGLFDAPFDEDEGAGG